METTNYNSELLFEAFNPYSLHLILLPTEKCNFRCTYCYEDFELGRMSSKVISGIKNLLINRANNLDILTISWFGGEPLLASDLVVDLSNFALSLSSHNKFMFRSNMTTNGYFLNLKCVEQLYKLNVREYQITLDGFEEGHNETRKLINTTGTFQQIWKNILAIRKTELDLMITLRIHYQSDSYQKLFTLLEKINYELGGDKRFKIFFKSIERLGGKKDDLIPIMSLREKENIIKVLNTKLHKSFQEPEDYKPYVCYASKPNSLVIRSNGLIGKCTVALNNPNNCIGRINEDGTLSINDTYLKKWTVGFTTMDLNTLACPLTTII